MSRPVVSALTERIYELLEPLHGDDEAYGYALLILSSAAAAMMEQAYGWTGDEDGEEPWQKLVGTADLGGGRPNEYLAQMLGLSVRKMEPGLVLFIMERGLAHMRGTVQYLSAVLSYFLGDDAVGIYERKDENLDPDPYGIVIRTIGALPPDARRVVEGWKPAGLIAKVVDTVGPTYSEIAGSGLTYAGFEAEVGTYNAVVDWTP